jgi:hypothetical protein
MDTTPVVDNPEVYKPYIALLKAEPNLHLPIPETSNANPSQNQISALNVNNDDMGPVTRVDLSKKPPEDSYVPGTLKKWRNNYYYVPISYRQAYFDLCLWFIQRPRSGPSTKIKAPGIKRTIRNYIHMNEQKVVLCPNEIIHDLICVVV